MKNEEMSVAGEGFIEADLPEKVEEITTAQAKDVGAIADAFAGAYHFFK